MTAENDSIARSLLEMLEIEQIKQLKARYFRLVDAKAWSEWRDCFTDDMQLYRDDGPVMSSADEFVSRVSANLAGSVTVHHGHMPEIELTGPSTASGVWSMVDWVDYPERPSESWVGYGHYFELYEKGGDGRWRIKRMQLKRLRMEYPNRTQTSARL